MKMVYQYCCVSPKSLEELEYIIDHSREITYKTFRSKIDSEEFNSIQSNLGYDKAPFNLKDDYAVSFYKSKLPSGKLVYYFCHSCIEHIFYN
jgi:hypothetical protein